MTYLDIKAKLTLLKFTLLGFLLIGLGISQAVTGWLGEALIMRTVYPAFAILFGTGIVWLCLRCLSGDAGGSNSALQMKGRAKSTFKQIASGAFGPFEITDRLNDDLEYLQKNNFIVPRYPNQQLPNQGVELCDYFAVAPDYLQKKS